MSMTAQPAAPRAKITYFRVDLDAASTDALDRIVSFWRSRGVRYSKANAIRSALSLMSDQLSPSDGE